MASNARSELRLSDIRPYLTGVVQKGSHIIADCPLCGKKGHLHIDEKDGKLLVYCQRCNAPGGEFFKEWRRMGAKPKEIDYQREEPVEDYRHIYRNPDGSEAYYKRRRKWADGHKSFSFAYRDASGKTYFTKPEGCNNLYNLDLLAKHEQEVLYIVEGEKCADAMVKHGLLATTSNTGAQKHIKLSPVDAELLNSYPVRIVIPDNDDKGADYAAAWAGAKVLRMTDFWPECPPKGDVADYFAAGGSSGAITEFKWREPVNLDLDYIVSLDRYQLIDTELLEALQAINDPAKRQQILSLVRFRASELHCKREFESCWRSYQQQQAAKGIKSDNMTKFSNQLFALRSGQWQTGNTGVWRGVQVGMELKNEYASPIPIMPVELLVNVEDETEKIRLAFFKDGVWRKVVVPRSIIANKNKIILLADNGVEVNSDNCGLLVKYLADVIALNPDILPRSKSIDHMGWADVGFVPYTDDVKLDCEEQYKSLISSVATKGTLEEWVEYIKPLRENLLLRLTMGASFASVLIAKVDALPFVWHLWGGTGSGKTVASMVAASIWGNPRLGAMVRTMNMTVNSMMNIASILHNLPFFGDELQTIKTRFENYDTLIMRISEGIDRGRMTNATLQKQRTWANNFIFTGEEPCTKAASGGGVKNRVIEIECDGKIIEDGNGVVRFINSHYGCAGKAFIEAISTRNLAKDYQEIMRLILEVTSTTEKQAMAMALILLGDSIAEQEIFKSNNILTPLDVIDFVKSKSEVDPAERAFRILMDVIAENRDKFEEDYNDSLSRVRWGKIKPGIVLINKTVLERELDALGFDYAALKKKWAEAGYLIKTNQGKFFRIESVNGVKGSYVALKF